ncbi:MAG: hypothetical protein A4E72_01802 [Syntrophus sp. PtaU1.Bin208]|nr:MAG: hypothetical protein A4E72_01802 [Syntrophus sp. PtaU1.Bin208]
MMIRMKVLLLTGALVFSLLSPLSSAFANIVAYYSFDGTPIGPAYTVSGASMASGGGYGGTNAYSFDGSNDYLSAPVDINPGTLPQMTMGAWVKAANGSPIKQVISHDNGGYDRSLGIDSRGGSTGWSAFSGSGAVLGSFPVTLNEWTFVAVTYDQMTSSVMLYVNGSAISESGSLGNGWNSIRIGSNPSYGEYFNGIIDDVFILDEALSKDELDVLWKGAHPVVPIPGALWLFAPGIAGLLGIRRRFCK